MIDKKKDEVKTEGKMPLVNVVIVLIGVVVLFWLIFVFVVVEFESADPGEVILSDERVARPSRAIVHITDDEGNYGYHDSGSERRVQLVADGHPSLGIQGSGISTVGQDESNPVASNETDYGRQQDRRVAGAIFPKSSIKRAAENG